MWILGLLLLSFALEYIWYRRKKDGILRLVSPALLEETVHVSEFVHYAENGDSVTIPFFIAKVAIIAIA